MRPTTANSIKKKRKIDSVEEEEKEELPAVGALELDSDGQDSSVASDDGEMDEFPELDLGDSEEKTSESEELSEGIDEGSEDEEDGSQNEENGANAQNEQKPGDYIPSSITGRLKRVFPEIEPEYDSDSSTEDVRLFAISSITIHDLNYTLQAPNRVGNIPMHWYDDLPHVGYDMNGKRVLRPAKGDELDKFLATVEDPTSWQVHCL
jgi:ribosome biogenesis protein ERB1